MGYLDLKPPIASTKLTGNPGNAPNGSAHTTIQSSEIIGGKNPSMGNQTVDPPSSSKEQIPRAKSLDGRNERPEGLMPHKPRGGSSANGLDTPQLMPPGILKPSGTLKNSDEAAKLSLEESTAKVSLKAAADSEVCL